MISPVRRHAIGCRRADARGSSLLWAMLLLLVVAGGVATVASSLARRTQLVRSAMASAGTSDLRDSGLAVARARLSADSSYRGAERLRLAAGTVTVSVRCRDGLPLARVEAEPSAAWPATTWEEELDGLECGAAPPSPEGSPRDGSRD